MWMHRTRMPLGNLEVVQPGTSTPWHTQINNDECWNAWTKTNTNTNQQQRNQVCTHRWHFLDG